MYYILYLSSLCRRRRWTDPHYECQYNPSGISCTVRVNNREYQSESVVESEVLAREDAAKRAYLLCRNFSVTDGMHPGTAAMMAPPGNGASPSSHQSVSPPLSSGSSSSSSGGGLPPHHRGYLVAPNIHAAGGYVTGSLASQGNMPMDKASSSGRMVTPQGVIVVGHSQMGM